MDFSEILRLLMSQHPYVYNKAIVHLVLCIQVQHDYKDTVDKNVSYLLGKRRDIISSPHIKCKVYQRRV